MLKARNELNAHVPLDKEKYIEKLREELEEAIKDEAYKEAAKIHEKIIVMETKSGEEIQALKDHRKNKTISNQKVIR